MIWALVLLAIAIGVGWLTYWIVDEGARFINSDYDEDNDAH